MTIHFVINPHAGGVHDDRELADEIRAAFAGYDIHITTRLPQLTSCRSAKSGCPDLDLIVAVGGDGTVNRVLNCIGESGVPLGVIPRGTSNDLAHSLGIPTAFASACALIKQVRPRVIDLVAVNDRYFATCGGLGVPAAAAQRANHWRRPLRRERGWMKNLGRLIYPLAVLFELCCAGHPIRASLRLFGARYDGDWTAIAISNQSRLGGFTLSAAASPVDGLLDLCRITAPRRRAGLLRIAWLAWRGRLDRSPEVTQQQAREIVIVTQEPLLFLGDGEILSQAQVFHIRVVPGALRVVAPPVPDTGLASGPGFQTASETDLQEAHCG